MEEESSTLQTDEYFESYSDLEVHKLMLNDHVRNEAYRKAICDSSLFVDKVVLDVGSGTGFLAILCAQAGARKVYAVEASDMAELATITVHENNFADTIQVIQSKIEEVELPERVDIIVSEWMGFYLLHESMLDCVIVARDKFLKPDGVMYPSRCVLYSAPSYSPEIFKFWDNIAGVKMGVIGQLYRTKFIGKPEIMELEPNNIPCKPTEVFSFNTKDIQITNLRRITNKVVAECHKKAEVNCIALWFEVYFPAEDSEVILSTAPVLNSAQLTHWKQTVIILPQEKPVDKGEKICYNLSISKNTSNPRHYNIELSFLDPEEQIQAQESQGSNREEFYKHHNADSDYEEYNSGSDD